MSCLFYWCVCPVVLEWYASAGCAPTRSTLETVPTMILGLLHPKEAKVRQRDGDVHVYQATVSLYSSVGVGDRLGLPAGTLYRVGRVEQHRGPVSWWEAWLDEDLR